MEAMELLSSLEKEDILKILSDTDGFCQHCRILVHHRIRKLKETSNSDEGFESSSGGEEDMLVVNGNASIESISESSTKRRRKRSDIPRNSFLAHDSALVPNKDSNGHTFDSSPKSLRASKKSDFDLSINDGIGGSSLENKLPESEEQRELIRYSLVQCEKDFTLIERVNGRKMNVLQGIELHSWVFNPMEQRKIVECIYRLQWKGKQGKLRERTYSEPRKWMRGKGRVTIQFGCCYNYAMDKNGNPPGIVRGEEVDPLPPLFKQMIKRMVRWKIVPSNCIPDSCIVNIYDEGDCIPPHIDHHDFVRPFYTVSFLNECKILFGANLQVLSPGEFYGPASITMPVGSVFVFNGNGADVAKHCIPSVSLKRISITFRKMDEKKLPHKFSPDPELIGIKPLTINKLPYNVESESETISITIKENFHVGDVFSPPNGSFGKLKVKKFGHRQ